MLVMTKTDSSDVHIKRRQLWFEPMHDGMVDCAGFFLIVSEPWCVKWWNVDDATTNCVQVVEWDHATGARFHEDVVDCAYITKYCELVCDV